MKKWRAIFLIFCLLAQTFVYTTLGEDGSAEVSGKAQQHIRNLGILANMTEFDYSEYPVTRAELAAILTQLTGASHSKTISFRDVSTSTKYYEDIMACAEYHYMNGYGDGSFLPEQPVTYYEVLKTFISLLGYEKQAEYKGGYPTGYYSVSKDLDLCKGVSISSYDQYVSQRVFPQLIYQLLLTPCNELVAVEGDMVTYQPSDILFSEKYLKLKFQKGIIETDEISDISMEAGELPEDRIKIAGTLFEYVHSWRDRLTGKKAEIFYSDENDLNHISSLVMPEDENKEVELFADQIISTENNRLEYEQNDKNLKVSISSDTQFLYNGELVLSFDFSSLTDEKIIFLDNDKDGRYEIARIEKMVPYVVDSVLSDRTVKDVRTGYQVSLSENQDKELFLEDSEGKEITWEAVEQGMVLNVLENGTKRIAILRDDKISGTLEAVNDGSSKKEITVDQKIYSVLPTVAVSAFRTGDLVDAYVDYYGRVFYLTARNGSTVKYAYLIDGSFEDGLALSLRLKLLTETGEVSILEVRDTFYFNTQKYVVESRDKVPSEILSNAGFKRQLIGYSTDSDGKIRDIITPDDQPGQKSFFCSLKLNNTPYSQNGRTLGEGKIMVDARTKIFVIPTDENNREDEKYVTMSANDLNTMQSYPVEAYQTGDRQTTDILVLRGSFKGVTYETPTVVFLRKTASVDENGETKDKIYYFEGNQEKSAYIDYSEYPAAQSLDRGDVLRVSLEGEKVAGFEYLYDFDQEKWMLSRNPTDTSYQGSNRISYGYIAAYDGEIIRMSYEKDFDKNDVYSMEGYRAGSFSKILVSDEGGRISVRAALATDIHPQDRVIFMLRSGIARQMILLQKSTK